jgi:aconitate hydratase
LREFSTGSYLKITLKHADGKQETISAQHSFNEAQIEWFKEGSALNIIRKLNP